ncbi:BamA/TamA family outer membrane protein [Bacteroidota bacterium]
MEEIHYKAKKDKPFKFFRSGGSKLLLLALSISFWTICINVALSQDNQYIINGDSVELDPQAELIIDKIFIVGNRRTKEQIILRELGFREGNLIKRIDLEERIKKDKQKLMNTRLFMSVEFDLIDLPDGKVDAIIRVTERWYFFPIPIFELADRNFVDWWVNHKHDLKRIEYGLKLYQYNVRGRNETLKLVAQFGYTKRFELAYSFPYIDKNQKWGLNIFGGYSVNRNTAYKTEAHKRIFLDGESMLRERTRAGISTTYRKSFYNFHTFGVNYYYSHVQDTIIQLNPNYFLNNGTEQRYFELEYIFIRDLRDVAQYPLNGFYILGSIEKKGLGIYGDVDKFELSALYNKYWDLGKKFYLVGSVGGTLSFPEPQPYNLLTSIGYRPFTLRGYELYVVEGQHFINSKWTFKRLLVKGNPQIETFYRADQLNEFPFAIYMKTYFDIGYVHNYMDYIENSSFTDVLIYGAGIGIDLVTFYDIVFRFEYSINKEGESGFVFGVRSNF